MGRRHDKFRKMFYYLERQQRTGAPFTLEELAEETGYKMSSIRTYYGKRLKGVVVEELGEDRYRALGVEAFDEEGFIDYLTQRSSPAEPAAADAPPRGDQAPQQPGGEALLGEEPSRSGDVPEEEEQQQGRERAEAAEAVDPGELIEDLTGRSAELFHAALRGYHTRASRAPLGQMVALLLPAWELLLRAELVKIRGPQSALERLDFTQLLSRFFPNPRDAVRRNLQWVLELREHHAALLIEETAPYLSRLLQSNALNFRRRWEAVAERELFARGAGLIALGVSGQAASAEAIAARYGEPFAEALETLWEALSQEDQRLGGHPWFQSAPAHRLVLSPVIDANQVALCDHHATLKAAERMRHQVKEGWRASHPFTPSEVVHEINRRLPYDLRLTASAVEVIDAAHQVRAAARSPFYIRLDEAPFHVYARAYVDWVVNAIEERGDFIKRAQEAARRVEE